MKILALGGSLYWSQLGDVTTNVNTFLRNPEDFGLVTFGGGADISPSIYGHKNLDSYTNPGRDKLEVKVSELASAHKVAQVGICRGMQLLNALNGGTLVQHMRGHHSGHHACHAYGGEVFPVNSMHHQMCVLGPGGRALAWADEVLDENQCVYDGELPKQAFDPSGKIPIIEALVYQDARALGCQWHPEWLSESSEGARWVISQVEKLLFKKRSRRRETFRARTA